MIRWNDSNGSAPLTIRPLMKKVGVALTPASSASCTSASIEPLYLCVSTQAVELCRVQSEIHRVLLQVGVRELRRLSKKAVVIRPELVLFGGARGRLGRGSGVRMAGKREVTINEMNTVAVLCEHLSTVAWARRQYGHWKSENSTMVIGADAEPFDGAFVVAIFDPRRFQHDAHRRLRLERVDIRFARILHPLLCEIRADRRAHLVEWCPLHPRLICLIPAGHVAVGDRTGLRRDLLLDYRRSIHSACLRVGIDQRRRDDLIDRGPSRFV